MGKGGTDKEKASVNIEIFHNTHNKGGTSCLLLFLTAESGAGHNWHLPALIHEF